jgi:hypothetical protein
VAEDLEFLKALADIPPIVNELIEYRLHYDSSGGIVMCTQQSHPENTQYLVVSADEYHEYFRYYIVDGKLKKIDTNPGYRVQLKSSTQGYAVVKGHAGILLENETYKDIEYYDDN